MKKLILKPPSYNDLLRLLAAWRVWIRGAVLGAAFASVLYLIVPPTYRAQATVLVDQHVEQVIPQEQTDLRKFNYLQRETDKLLVIAWDDQNSLTRYRPDRFAGCQIEGWPPDFEPAWRWWLALPGRRLGPCQCCPARLSLGGRFRGRSTIQTGWYQYAVAGQFCSATGSAGHADRFHGIICILWSIFGNYPAGARLAFL